MTGLNRVATKVAMYKALRTEALPPQMVRWPFRVPLSRGKGARPTRAEICLRPMVPSSGSSASRVRPLTGPTLGVEHSKSWFYFQVPFSPMKWSRYPISAIQFLFEKGDMSGDTFFDRFRGRDQVIFLSDDHVDDLSSTCGQRSEFQSELVGQRARLGTNRFGVVSHDCRIDAIGLGHRPVDLAKSLIWRGLTMTTEISALIRV